MINFSLKGNNIVNLSILCFPKDVPVLLPVGPDRSGPVGFQQKIYTENI